MNDKIRQQTIVSKLTGSAFNILCLARDDRAVCEKNQIRFAYLINQLRESVELPYWDYEQELKNDEEITGVSK